VKEEFKKILNDPNEVKWEKFLFSPVELYWRQTKLISQGEVFDFNRFKKYFNQNHVELKIPLDLQKILLLDGHMAQNASLEELSWYHLLNTFKLTKTEFEKIADINHSLCLRSFYLSTLMYQASINLGLDKNFAQDLYNLVWLSVLGFSQEDFHYLNLLALEAETIQENGAKSVFHKFKVENVAADQLFNYPVNAFLNSHNNLNKILNYPDTIHALKYLHERITGVGFPQNINSSSMYEYELMFVKTYLSFTFDPTKIEKYKNKEISEVLKSFNLKVAA
jgi:hypothetical protein